MVRQSGAREIFETVGERNLDMFRDKIYDALIIKRENFPESYFELQKRIARERGQAVEEIPEDVRDQMMSVAIEDQKTSLNAFKYQTLHKNQKKQKIRS